MYALGDVLVATFPGNSAGTGNYNAATLHWLAHCWHPGGNAAISPDLVVAGLVKMRWFRAVSGILAVLGFLSLLFLGMPSAIESGLWERGAVYRSSCGNILAVLLIAAVERTTPATGMATVAVRPAKGPSSATCANADGVRQLNRSLI